MLSMKIVLDSLCGLNTNANLTKEDGVLKGIRFENTEEYLYIYSEDKNVFLSSNYGKIEVKNTSLDIVYNMVCEKSEELEEWNAKMQEMIFNNCSLQDLVDISQDIIKNAFFITDESNHTIAMTSHEKGTVTKEWDYIVENKKMIVEVLQEIFNSELFKRNFYSKFKKSFYFHPKSLEFGSVSFRIPSPKSNGYMGTIVILETKRAFPKGIYYYAEILGEAVSRWVKMHYQETPMASAAIAFESIIKGEMPSESQKVLLNSILESRNGTYRIVTLSPVDSQGIESYIYMFEENFYDCVFCNYENKIMILLSEHNIDTVINSVRVLLKYKIGTIGVSKSFCNLDKISGFARQALFAQSYEKSEVVYFDSECAVKYISKEIREGIQLESIVHTSLFELIEHDSKHKTEYCLTLYTFLIKERSISETLPILNIHRNSMIYRLKRIDELLNADLNDFFVREHLLVSFEILNMFNEKKKLVF